VKNYFAVRYSILGIILGILVATSFILFQVNDIELSLTLSSLITLQQNASVLWIVIVLPILLGIWGFIYGSRINNLDRVNSELKFQVNEKVEDIDDLSSNIENLQMQYEYQQKTLVVTNEISRASITSSDINAYFEEVVNSLSNRYGYITSIFVIDENREHVVLQAVSTEGAGEILERGLRLKVGPKEIIGSVPVTGEPMFAIDESQVYRSSLMKSHSEAAFPLKINDYVVGVLDFHSNLENAFSEEIIDDFKTLSILIAMGLKNIQERENTIRDLRELEDIYRRQSKRVWEKYIEQNNHAYRYDGLEVYAVEDLSRVTNSGKIHDVPENQKNNEMYKLVVPINFQDESIGSIELKRDTDKGKWTERDIELVMEAIAQVSPALESARLIEEAQIRAVREKIITDISSKVRRSTNIDFILQTAVEELTDALRVPVGKIRLRSSNGDNSDDD
jgi:GAF domain-containing protein